LYLRVAVGYHGRRVFASMLALGALGFSQTSQRELCTVELDRNPAYRSSSLRIAESILTFPPSSKPIKMGQDQSMFSDWSSMDRGLRFLSIVICFMMVLGGLIGVWALVETIKLTVAFVRLLRHGLDSEVCRSPFKGRCGHR